LRHFGSVRRIREADAEALAQVPGVSLALAERIRECLSTLSRAAGSATA